ncbi:tetratricopeptide repeat protein [Streptomyces sp. AM 2-1-1]|uniref:tetratricopeptide repeat protein n=1 Tax=Streptomyces sp. AM 2-1-1 TaxID=3028709 RepID=UPI0023B9250B|nr:tetratricopeptide repeat protein [Streptomyces sp. AM 2-1-1]WEH41607.1 tetratricopeptide repeat protein [Streptomyces sp. AM 2-1-1]
MDVMPQQDPDARPQPSVPSAPGGGALPAPGALPPPPDALPPPPDVLPPPSALRTSLRRAAVGAVAAGVLVAGALAAVPEEDRAAAVPGAADRARAATTAGAPASLSELTALIRDRQGRVRSRPADAPAWAALGSAYVQWARRSADSGYYPRAEEALKRSLAAVPGERGNSAAWVGLAELADARNDFPAAKKWGETVRDRAPKDPGTWTVYPALIDAYNGLGDYAAAGAATERFAALRKGAAALGRTAERYRDLGWREDALVTAQEAAARSTTPAQKAGALHRLGDLARERGEPGEALAQYDAALRTDRGHHASLAGRARALTALGRSDEAMVQYQRVLERLPRPEYALELAELYQSLDLDGDAASQYRTFLRMTAGAERNGVDESVSLARYESDHGDPRAAVALMRAAWSGGRRSAEVADALGWALHRAGRPEEGLEFAARAADSGVRSASYAYHLGAIEAEAGDRGAARRHLSQALRTDPEFSPLGAPAARRLLDGLGEPPAGGPQDLRDRPDAEEAAPESRQEVPAATAARPGPATPAVSSAPAPKTSGSPPAPVASAAPAVPAAAAAPAASALPAASAVPEKGAPGA